MASDDSMIVLSSMHEDDEDFDDDDHHHNRYNMSRLSMCTGNTFDDDDDDDTMINMSSLSLDDGLADGELSDDKEAKDDYGMSENSDSDKESEWFSLPTTPRRRILGGGEEVKEYYSENEQKAGRGRGSRRTQMRRGLKERWMERAWRCKVMDDETEGGGSINYGSGESESVVIARPKGGGRCLRMDMEEVKACRDLGFELQPEWMVEIPSRVSALTVDTDSGGNSPIATWRISSPGDDPRDVKARLKVWAQAVALASASRLSG